MKKIGKIKYLTIVILLLLTVSCDKEFLNQPPYGVLTTESFYKTQGELDAALIVAYNSLQTLERNMWVLNDIGSDDAEKGGESESDNAPWQDISISRQLTGNSLVSEFWTNLYAGIANCNMVIDKSTGIKSQPELVTRCVNEAKFLRGLFYSMLAANYGDVPLITHYLNSSELNQTRKPVAEVWAQVESDLIAATNLPTKSQWGSTGIGRATSGAAYTVLGKVYMFQHKYVEAEAALANIVKSDQYSLVADYGSIFRKTGQNNAESILEIQHLANVPGVWEGTWSVVFQHSRDLKARGWGFNTPTQDLLKEFEPGDPRIIYTFIFVGDEFPQKDGSSYVVANQQSPTGYSNRKIFQIEVFRDANMYDQGVNYRYLRYSDVLLLYAEALNENNKQAQALLYLNMVRARARNTPKVDPERKSCAFNLSTSGSILPDVTTTDKLLLRNAIWHERRCELGMEMTRRWDLIRTGRFKERMEIAKAARGITVDVPKELLLPIPQSEIDASMNLLVQNPDY